MKTKFLTLFCCLFLLGNLSSLVSAQTKPQQSAMVIQAELSKRGLTEAEASAALATIGIDAATLTPEIIVARQEDIAKALDAAAAKKAAPAPATENNVNPSIVGENSSTTSEKLVEAAADNAQKTAVEDAPPSGIYGHSLFTDQSLEIFRTTEGAKAPDSYILGAGDRIRITIFGVSQADLQLEINSEGYIQPAGLPQIYLQGVNLADARRLLRQRFGQAYRFQSDQFTVTIQTARTIQVNIFGETKLRGTFTLSALNSPFGALMAAGGPNELGSVRAIELVRGKSRKTVDVYAFLQNPAMATTLDLQNNDIIYVPIARTVVSIEGPVKRPMRYEVIPNEGLRELFEMAGGLQFNSYSEFVQLERMFADSAALLEFRLSDVLSGKIKVPLADGDIVRVKASQKALEAYSEIGGAVFYPGRYAFSANMKLGDLIQKAQLRPEAILDAALLERTNRDGTTKLIKLAAAEFNNYELQFMDKVTIFSKSQFTNQAPLSVVGAVRTPFERSLEFGDEILLENAILAAGGLTPTAEETAYVRRTDLSNPEKVVYLQVNLNRDKSFQLRAGDQLTVYDKTLYSLGKSLRVTGAVNTPGVYTFDPSLKLADVIRMSGGFTLTTDISRVDVFRLKYDKTRGTGYERIVLELDSNFQHVGLVKNFVLAPFDIVVVRDLPMFDLNRTVQLAGQVLYPGTYGMEASRVHISHIIKKAGGLNVLADVEYAIIIRAAGNKGIIGFNPRKALKNEGNKKHDPILLPGDVIEIQVLQNTVGIRIRATREADLLNDGVDIGNKNENDIRYFTYRGNRSARWYVRNLSGGFADKANKNSVAVIYPDGSVVGTRKYLWVFRDYPNLKPGAVVSLTYKVPKPAKEKEKIDVDVLYTRTLTSLTSLMTLLILSRQL